MQRSRSRGRKAAAVGAGGGAAAAGAAVLGGGGGGVKARDDSVPKDSPSEVPHFEWVRGQILGPSKRYVVRKVLGDGTFGRVLACKDTQTQDNVAIKVVKGVRRYCEHAQAEAEVLREIQRLDPGRQSHCVELKDTFLHPRRHFCLVFEHLDVSLRDFLKDNDGRGLLLPDVKSIAEQLLQCVSFLHAIGVVHTDLKCRNVLFRDSRYDPEPLPRQQGATTRRLRSCDIVVIDFGGALFADQRTRSNSCIGTRQFRAPEVVLGLAWDEKTDVWSAGCLVAMAYLGVRPFNVKEDMEHLALFERRLSRKIPVPMVKEAAREGSLSQGVVFDSKGRLEWPTRAPDEEAAQRVEESESLKDLVRPQHNALLALLEGMLNIDPKRRLSAEAASALPFVMGATATE